MKEHEAEAILGKYTAVEEGVTPNHRVADYKGKRVSFFVKPDGDIKRLEVMDSESNPRKPSTYRYHLQTKSMDLVLNAIGATGQMSKYKGLTRIQLEVLSFIEAVHAVGNRYEDVNTELAHHGGQYLSGSGLGAVRIKGLSSTVMERLCDKGLLEENRGWYRPVPLKSPTTDHTISITLASMGLSRDLLALGYNPAFGNRPTIDEATEFLTMVAHASGTPPEVVTAAMVLLNTYIKVLCSKYDITPKADKGKGDQTS